MKIISFGEIIWDVYPDHKSLGGAPLNFAIHCAALGAESSMISAVGNDELGSEALDTIKVKGVSARFVPRNERPTGACFVTLDERKIPSYRLMRDTAYDLISLSDSDIDSILKENFDAICFGTLIQRSEVSRASLRRLIEKGGAWKIFCDVNLRKGNYDADSVRFCLESAEILKVSLEEAPDLTALGVYPSPLDSTPESLSTTLFSSFPKLSHLILTDGERGAYSASRGGELIFCNARKIKVVSTVGAGDSFGAAWLISHFSGDSPTVSLQKAVDYSARVISGEN